MEGPSALRRFLVPAVFVFALFALLFFRDGGNGGGSGEWTFRGPTMGTTWTVKIADPDLTRDQQAAIESTVKQTVDQIDQRMSTWKDDSELSLLNRHDTTPYQVSSELMGVLVSAAEIHRITGGAFDITVEPLDRA